ncbi:hypothetical protein PPS11_28753 [Pseudomonas putida S11]|nr:hypothetical protein PPS11_28753 [Pseudomonas putida S11]
MPSGSPGRLVVLLEQRAGHAVVRVQVHRGRLDRPDHAKRSEQGGGKARSADRLGDLGQVLEPLLRKQLISHFGPAVSSKGTAASAVRRWPDTPMALQTPKSPFGVSRQSPLPAHPKG